ncbi:CLUMA_CG019592, isoform A [Clunio marinus]|uniref:CLUMA_CG019592, isoform A n=1 Tax=Clunio marinus TaxID=568069 RepID=A0A1J1J376_9DIPT|nr:CLUMA_CG019592, isoform A [Clunio marinus]
MMQRRGGGKFRGGNRYNYYSDRFQSEHDDRSGGNKTEIKRVTFKTGRHINNRNINDNKLKAFLDDEDMVGELTQGEGSQRLSGEFKRGGTNFRNRRNRKGSPIPGRHVGGSGKLIQHPMGWYQVTIQHGAKYEKNIVLKLLLDGVSPSIFIPNYFKADMDTKLVNFFVDDYEVAQKIMRLDRKIELPDGFQIMIRVRGCVPQTKLDATVKERMKNAMVKRYNQATKALDLTKFHADPDLTETFCALSRPPIMSAAIDIIAENIPDLEALNLNDNKLNMLDHLKGIASKLSHLKILYLGNNKIFMLNSLDSLRGLPLVELFLDGNPFRKRVRDQANYVSELRKKFPKLLKLDGAELGPTIGFDVADEPSKQLPPWKAAYLCDPSGSELVQKFLEQYFILYDSDNRQQLLEAYHEQAIFSLTATNNQHYTPEEKLHAYWKVGRNLHHPRGFDYRLHSIKRGKLNVVALLTELPPSRHDPQSFAVDLTVFTPQLVVLTVTGLFKERNSNPRQEYTRAFQRTMVIVPNNGGFCIKNELLHVNNASQSQARNAFKGPVATSPQMTSPSSLPTTPQQAVSAPDDATKMQMIQAMSQQSNMNIEWSRKCLEETSWDFQRAIFVFSELFKQNKIPPEAFVK